MSTGRRVATCASVSQSFTGGPLAGPGFTTTSIHTEIRVPQATPNIRGNQHRQNNLAMLGAEGQ